MTTDPNAVSRHASGYQRERYGYNGFTECYARGSKRHKSKRCVFIIVFLLAAVCTAVTCAWLLNIYGAALQPSLENAYQVMLEGITPPPVIESPDNTLAVPFAEQLPNEVPVTGSDVIDSLDVSLIYQNPELKNGCEATSLAMLLRYFGYSVDKSILAYEYIPREDFQAAADIRYGPHPGTAYPGDPATTKGFYCYPGPIITGANRFLAEQGESLQAYDISGASKDDFARELQDGHPVMVWITMDYGTQPTYLDFTWLLPDGKIYTPYGNLHCVVLSGLGNSDYQVCDPINGSLEVSQEVLFNSYQVVGSMAVVVK